MGRLPTAPATTCTELFGPPQLTPFFPCLHPLDQAVAKPDGSSPGAKTKEPLRDAVVTLPHHRPQSSFCPG